MTTVPRRSNLVGSAALLLAAMPVPAAETLSAGQLEAAARVFTGAVDCEFNQKISVQPIEGAPGHFKLTFNKLSYHLVPQETTIGAVRLEDRQAGVVWLQTPAKSILMNAKLGQRMVDSCQHAGQRAAVAPAGAVIGIATAQTPR
jgi:hypothetical protein